MDREWNKKPEKMSIDSRQVGLLHTIKYYQNFLIRMNIHKQRNEYETKMIRYYEWCVWYHYYQYRQPVNHSVPNEVKVVTTPSEEEDEDEEKMDENLVYRYLGNLDELLA